MTEEVLTLAYLQGLPAPTPGQSDEAWCWEAWDGREWECRRCVALRRSPPAIINLPGICERCDRELEEKEREKHKPKTDDEALERAGIPVEYRSYRWSKDHWPSGMTDAQKAEFRGWRGDPPICTIWGPKGTGKSIAAGNLARDWHLNGYHVLWRNLEVWLDEMRYLESEGGSYGPIKFVCDFNGLVVLDEVVTNRVTDFGLDVFLKVLESRYNEHRPLLMTSNLRPASGEARIPSLEGLDPRIGSRAASGLVFAWTGKDRRTT